MIEKQLASALGRKDEGPNLELAEKLTQTPDIQAIQDLVQLLFGKNKNLQNDSIKVLYEIGEKKPSLIHKYVEQFVELLSSKNNRLQWGAMTALKTIGKEFPNQITVLLPTLNEAANRGSVITKDNYVAILVELLEQQSVEDQVFNLLIHQFESCPTNQLRMYAEMACTKLKAKHIEPFTQVLSLRLDEIEKESKRKRIEKIIAKMNKATARK